MSGLPLHGVRVIDLTMVWAGPLAASMLADMGAEVIKVESRRRQDAVRYLIYPKGEPGEDPWNRSGYFQRFNRNKYGITLDLTTRRGVEIFKQLVLTSDVVMENFTPRVMENFGLDYPVLRSIRPDIVMISMPAFGRSGPYRDYLGFGNSVEAMSGLSSMMGYEDGPPILGGVTFGDPVAGVHAAFAILAALHYRERTGKGQHIEIAQRECFTRFIGEAIMDYTMNGRVGRRMGNRHQYRAPHGCYPCKGEDEWVVIDAGSDEEWDKLCEVMGKPALAQDKRFFDSLSRWKNQDELNKIISEWTRQHDHYEVMRLLQGAGVPAGAVLTNKELLEDEHLKKRHFFHDINHPGAGVFPQVGPPVKLSCTPGSIRMHGPRLGEHNQLILSGLLGVSGDELDALVKEGIIGTEPLVAQQHFA
ncbi:MAG: CoA transferase [Chloroflexi bacterium]|nr:CoA transferase [Chloroflexota bacterium]